MMDDLAQVWRGETLAPLAITFRDYVMAEQARRQTSAWHDAWDYWQEKLPQLPLAPELPVVETPPGNATLHHLQIDDRQDRMAGRETALAAARRHTVCRAAGAVVPPPLSARSRTTTFTLNLADVSRSPADPSADQPVDWWYFTSVTLVDFKLLSAGDVARADATDPTAPLAKHGAQ